VSLFAALSLFVAACSTPVRQAYRAERLSDPERQSFVTALARMDGGDAAAALQHVETVALVEPW
jgi:surfactin synthase thioesterase subunit